MKLLQENMRLIAECSGQLIRLCENLWGKEQEITSVGDVNIKPLDVPTMTTNFVKEHGLPCPNGYIFKDENGNVINATKIVLEKNIIREEQIEVKEATKFVSLVKRMREAQKVYSETFPTGYECYAPTELESEVDEYLKKMEE